jgi:hypothetical protein
MGHRLDHVGPGNEHVAGAVHHEDAGNRSAEVNKPRHPHIGGPMMAISWNHPPASAVAQKDVSIIPPATQRLPSESVLLRNRLSRSEAHLLFESQIHHFTNFQRSVSGKRIHQYREVLRATNTCRP